MSSESNEAMATSANAVAEKSKKRRKKSSKYSPAGAERQRRLQKKKKEEAVKSDPERIAASNRVASFKYNLLKKETSIEKLDENLEKYINREERIQLRADELKNTQYAALPPPGWTKRTADRFLPMPYDIEHEINILERKSRGNPPYRVSKFVIDKQIEFLRKCINNVYLMPYPVHLAAIVPEERQYRAVPLHIEDVIGEHQAKAKRLREVADPRYHVEEAQVEYLNYCNNQLLPLGNLQYIKYSESLRKFEDKGQVYKWLIWETKHGRMPTPDESDEEYSTSFANSRKRGEASASKFWTFRY